MTRLSLDRSSLTALVGSILILTWGCASTPPPTPAVEEEVEAPVASDENSEAASDEARTGEEQEYSNTLRWTTASELDNFAFDVYRGDHEEGPFERLTESPISGAGTTDITSRYSFEDSTIDPYRAYYYYVESISLQGVREQFTPIIHAKPKLPADPGDDGDGNND